MLALDTSQFVDVIKNTIQEVLKDQQPDYIGWATVKEFRKISGISQNDLEKKVLTDKDFKKFVHRFPGSRNRYIEIKPALYYIKENIFIKEG